MGVSETMHWGQGGRGFLKISERGRWEQKIGNSEKFEIGALSIWATGSGVLATGALVELEAGAGPLRVSVTMRTAVAIVSSFDCDPEKSS